MLTKSGSAELLSIKVNNNNTNGDKNNEEWDDIKSSYAGCTANVILIYKR